MLEPKPQKISPRTMKKLIAARRKMEDDGVPAKLYSYTHQIDVAFVKADLVPDLIDCIENLLNSKAHMPSVEKLLREAKAIK